MQTCSDALSACQANMEEIKDALRAVQKAKTKMEDGDLTGEAPLHIITSVHVCLDVTQLA